MTTQDYEAARTTIAQNSERYASRGEIRFGALDYLAILATVLMVLGPMVPMATSHSNRSAMTPTATN